MIFSQNTIASAQKKFEALLVNAKKEKANEIAANINRLENSGDNDVVTAVKWIYANSPLSDAANYDFKLFEDCARHGVFLRKNSRYAKDIQEDIFLNYVLHIRVNEEELCDCRSFFYNLLADRIDNMSMKDAIIEANYWNAENVMYQSTDSRTVSALTAFNSCYGRCGEESAFGVNVYRAIGIPARQIYTPRWAHCDDNHAWVEVYCDGAWHFLGACEPEEVLNKGWFTNASSRAMLIHSRCFGEIAGEESISKVGMATFLNNLKLYAITKNIKVKIVNKDKNPIEGAKVSFGILNYSNIFASAILTTDKFGEVNLTCGLGTINIHVQKDDIFCESMYFVPDIEELEIVLENQAIELDRWQNFIAIAPKDNIVNGARPTDAQKELCHKKTINANAMRELRVEKMLNVENITAVVKAYSYCDEISEILSESRGNLNNLIKFLQSDEFTKEEKEKTLISISKKDRRDIDIEILKEAIEFSRQYKFDNIDMYYKYLVCPRVHTEPLAKNREFIFNYFTDAEKQQFSKNPNSIWEYINSEIAFNQDIEYGQIVTRPVGALTVKNASYLSKKILFVSICRAMGVMARLNPLNQLAEYFDGDSFITVEQLEIGSCKVIFEKDTNEAWQYFSDFSVGVLTNGEYQTLNLQDTKWQGNSMEITVPAGNYRIITDNRLPNGNLYSSKYYFIIGDNEIKTVKLYKYQADLSQMLDNFSLEEFKLFDENGNKILGSEITKNKAVLIWLEQGKEPTEHILNEMLDQKEDFENLDGKIIFIIKDKQALTNAKLSLVLKTFKNIQVYYDTFEPNVEVLARRMYVDPEKLPLIIVTTKQLNAVYACSGYNVGSGDMIVKIINNF